MILSVVFSGLFLSIVGAVGAYVALRLDTRRHRRRMIEMEYLVDIQRNQVLELQTRMLILLSDNTVMKNKLEGAPDLSGDPGD